MIKLKRAYDPVEESDGYRVLVDRLWPRGESKEQEKFDLWLKAVAPSTELRKWFAHDTEKFSTFQSKYKEELQQEPARTAFEQLKKIIHEQKTVTLVFAAKNRKRNNAVVLKNLLEQP